MRNAAAGSILVLTVLSACNPDRARDVPATGGDEAAVADSELVASAPTEYVTSFQFLTTQSGTTPGLILQFSTNLTRSGLDNRYVGWLLDRSSWRSVLDAEFHEAITRAPWRLLPADSFDLVVAADGDPEALVFEVRNASYTLDLGAHLDAWEDRSGTRHDIHEAQWTQAGRRTSGIAVSHRYAVPSPERPARFGPYERALLRTEDEAVIVLFHSRESETYGDSFAWMYADGLTRRWTSLEARTVEVANSSQLRRNVPVRFWFHIPEPDIRGELTAAARLFNEFPLDNGPLPYNGLYQVRGWIEFGGERRNVVGLLERGET